ncbi:MAG: hypothetical protein JXM70_14915 [Pirellulales bacterium]|nr:hypothetical protein [Pirellulales bacterium]
MSILRSRFHEAYGFPYDYDSVMLRQAEFDSITAAIRTRITDGFFAKMAEKDCCDADPDEIRAWLSSLPFNGLVNVIWIGEGEGVVIDYDCFVKFYDDLWFPSSDEVWLSTLDMKLVLQIDHEEQFELFSEGCPAE